MRLTAAIWVIASDGGVICNFRDQGIKKKKLRNRALLGFSSLSLARAKKKPQPQQQKKARRRMRDHDLTVDSVYMPGAVRSGGGERRRAHACGCMCCCSQCHNIPHYR